MNTSAPRLVAFAATLAALLLLPVATAHGAFNHDLEGGFPLTGVGAFGIDNSGGPSGEDVYVAETDFRTMASRVYQTDAAGAPTGVELRGSETPAGSFGFIDLATAGFAGPPAVSAVGVDAGDVYVPDIANHVVDRFSESGEYLCQITGLASPSPTECAGATGSTTPKGGLEPLSVAVDPMDGRVAVGDARGVVYLFAPDGSYAGAIEDPAHVTAPSSLAFDANGNIFVANAIPLHGVKGAAVEFGPSGNFLRRLAAESQAVAVDPGKGLAYVVDGAGVTRSFDAAGAEVSSLGSGASGVAVNAATHQVYLVVPGEAQIWSGPIVTPGATAGAATGVVETQATLNGRVDPAEPIGSEVVACVFEYGTDESYGTSKTCVPSTPYATATTVTGPLTNLRPATTYHYRLRAENADGRSGVSVDHTLTTLGPPSVETERSTSHTRSATVKAQINPFGYETTCRVEYVGDAAFQAGGFADARSVPCDAPLGADGGVQTASATIAGLGVDTSYHYRFLATNQGGSDRGGGGEFATFGIKSASIELLDREGRPYTQAGGHPYEMRVRIELPTTESLAPSGTESSVTANLRTVRVALPPGLIGDPSAVAQCPAYLSGLLRCSPDSQVGMIRVVMSTSPAGSASVEPLRNLVPPEGVAALLGGTFNRVSQVRIKAGVRTGSDYGIDTESLAITADAPVSSVEVRVWGIPGDPSHDSRRACLGSSIGPCPSGAPLVPFLTDPTACTGPLSGGISVDSWQDPGTFISRRMPMPGMVGCGRLDFSPRIMARPDITTADSPSGLHVDLHMPQNENPDGLAEADLRDAIVTLPEGMAVDPAGSAGLDGCSEAQLELHGPEPARCPDASKIGTVEIDTPLLDHPIKGGVYVAQQGNAGAAHGSNPFGSLLAIYIAVADPQSGVVVKLAGHVEADPSSGRLTTTFSENPQLPFEDFKLDFFGGPRAALQTPPTCGSYKTTTRLTPWTSPEGADANPEDSFAVDSAPGAGACPGSQLPLSAGLEAGATSPRAASYSPFVLKLSRQDGTQRLKGLNLTLPKGLTGRLAGTPYCPDSAIAQARSRSRPGGGAVEQASPSCPAASRVGTADVASGAGSTPIHVGGKAYLAGPYKGAPLSIVVITPAVAGPFDLGTVVVRTPLFVDEETAQISARSDAFPSILEGIPLDIRSIAINLERPEFTYTPSSCEAMAVTGEAVTTTGQVAPLNKRFQVGGCKGLDFRPRLKLRLKGATGRTGHPSLKAVVTMPAYAGEDRCAPRGKRAERLASKAKAERRKARKVGSRAARRRLARAARRDSRKARRAHRRAKSCLATAPSPEANIRRAQVNLPHSEFLDQGNLNRVCRRPVLLAGSCPKSTIYGHAKAWTSLLAKPLQGNVYLVGGYGYKLPALVADLNGQIRITLVGKVDSGKNKGIRNTFEVVPDAPVSRFELRMKGGKKYGLLVNSENLCKAKKSKRRAIVRFTGHNGKVRQWKPVVSNQCGRAKTKKSVAHRGTRRNSSSARVARRQGRRR